MVAEATAAGGRGGNSTIVKTGGKRVGEQLPRLCRPEAHLLCTPGPLAFSGLGARGPRGVHTPPQAPEGPRGAAEGPPVAARRWEEGAWAPRGRVAGAAPTEERGRQEGRREALRSLPPSLASVMRVEGLRGTAAKWPRGPGRLLLEEGAAEPRALDALGSTGEQETQGGPDTPALTAHAEPSTRQPLSRGLLPRRSGLSRQPPHSHRLPQALGPRSGRPPSAHGGRSRAHHTGPVPATEPRSRPLAPGPTPPPARLRGEVCCEAPCQERGREGRGRTGRSRPHTRAHPHSQAPARAAPSALSLARATLPRGFALCVQVWTAPRERGTRDDHAQAEASCGGRRAVPHGHLRIQSRALGTRTQPWRHASSLLLGRGCREEHPADTSLGTPLYFWDFEANIPASPPPAQAASEAGAQAPAAQKGDRRGDVRGPLRAQPAWGHPGPPCLTRRPPASSAHVSPQAPPAGLWLLPGEAPSKSDSDPTSEVSTLDPHPPPKHTGVCHTHTRRRPPPANSVQPGDSALLRIITASVASINKDNGELGGCNVLNLSPPRIRRNPSNEVETGDQAPVTRAGKLTDPRATQALGHAGRGDPATAQSQPLV
ncbi:collagen alpha-1(I) chain-like [Vulpes lagopus]|uniref:collagen alpha-1(I) chain-like n=1 Tax=Vulpes lagopus TaxID=494514 RepID=UPI001BC8DA7E|nr:collagen alpha-1(I) chain-like [Vulpes lagopus]